MAILKDARQLGCVIQDTQPPEPLPILRKSTILIGINSTSAIHKSHAASCKHPRKQRSVARKNSSQCSPYALNFWGGDWKTGAMWPLRRVEIGQEYLKAQREGQSSVLLTYQRMVSPSAIRNKTGGKRYCCRFLSIHAHVKQGRPELCRIGNRKGLLKSDEGCCSQRRSANKRRIDRACQRTRFIRDSKASRWYTRRSLTRNTLRGSRIFLRVDQWSETTTHQRWQTDKVQHGEPRTNRCPWFIDKLFKLIYTYISDIIIARSRSSYTPSPHQQEVRVQVELREYGETRRMNQQTPKKQSKMETKRPYGENRQNDKNNLRIFLWMKVFQLIGTHPRVLLVNQLQSRERSGIGQTQHIYSLPEWPKLRHPYEDQDNKGSLQKTHWRSRTSRRKFWWFNNRGSQSF